MTFWEGRFWFPLNQFKLDDCWQMKPSCFLDIRGIVHLSMHNHGVQEDWPTSQCFGGVFWDHTLLCGKRLLLVLEVMENSIWTTVISSVSNVVMQPICFVCLVEMCPLILKQLACSIAPICCSTWHRATCLCRLGVDVCRVKLFMLVSLW